MIEIATSLRFGHGERGSAWLRHGWSNPEEGFVWALGSRSSITLSLLPTEGRVLLELTVQPFVCPPSLPWRRLDIAVNGTLLAQRTLAVRETLQIEIPIELRRRPGLLIELHHPEAPTPAQLGLGQDSRSLAIQLHGLTLITTGPRDALPTPAGPATLNASYRFGGNEATGAMLLEGWGAPEFGYVWSVGRRSTLRLPAPPDEDPYTLLLDIQPYIEPPAAAAQRIAIGADDQLLGFISVSHRTCVAFTLPPRPPRAESVVLSFDNMDAAVPRNAGVYVDGRPFAFMLLGLRVLRRPHEVACDGEPVKAVRLAGTLSDGTIQQAVLKAAGVTVDNIAGSFESLGSTCELGLLQRRLGCENNGLLRFAAMPKPFLVAGIFEGFLGLGRPDAMTMEPRASAENTYFVAEDSYAMSFQTPISSRNLSPADLKEKLSRGLALLVRKFFEDVVLAEKTFVFQRREGTTRPEADAVLAALSIWGDITLLWVQQNPILAGGVERLAPRLLRGFVDELGANAVGSDESWLKVLTSAWLQMR